MRGRINGILAAILTYVLLPALASADVPCGGGEIDECRAYIEMNATDGDIGFHGLVDAEGWVWTQITDPDGHKLLKEQAKGSLKDQTLTETFFESEEPICSADLVEEPGEEVVTLEEFFDRFPAGLYEFRTKLPEGGMLAGWTEVTHALPAAPDDIAFDGSTITWGPGEDLDECEPEEGSGAGEVGIAAYQVVLEPDFDAEEPADEPFAARIFSVFVPPEVNAVTVPLQFLDSFPDDTPVKVEIIAIEERPNGSLGNQVAAEEDGFCLNEVEGCEEEDD